MLVELLITGIFQTVVDLFISGLQGLGTDESKG